MGWIIQENNLRTIDVADIYFKAQELLDYEKKFIKNC